MPEILTGNFAPNRWFNWPTSSLRIVDWNIDRGLQLKGIIDFLAGTKADVLLLQEADVNARRTHRLNIAEEIARKLQMNYVFGREFQELVQGSKDSPAYHGQATLARWPISKPRLIRFSRQSNFWQPRWFLPRMEPFQERLGGRIALVADVNVAGSRIATYNLHLESRSNDELRISQVHEVLADAARQNPDCPVIIAGDLNLDASKDAAAVAFAAAGFQDAVAGQGTPTTPSRRLFEPGHRIDWVFVRGPIRTASGQIHNRIKASDHYPISFTLMANG
ncbi:MAG TPA: endonuclease/exonuclease/phosphatase family protein [Terriglobales bacterium]|nr:endonuclease/exonuclease/phosphatase family protein [Terriglobales bacterium]